MQDEGEITDPCMEDPKQPCENQTVLYLWSNGQSTFWSHFNANETNNAGDNMYSQEKNQGVINIDERFSMNPQMSKRLNMTLDGEIRIVLNIYLEGDWTNNDNNGPCTNDCEELNVTLWAGATAKFQTTCSSSFRRMESNYNYSSNNCRTSIVGCINCKSFHSN